MAACWVVLTRAVLGPLVFRVGAGRGMRACPAMLAPVGDGAAASRPLPRPLSGSHGGETTSTVARQRATDASAHSPLPAPVVGDAAAVTQPSGVSVRSGGKAKGATTRRARTPRRVGALAGGGLRYNPEFIAAQAAVGLHAAARSRQRSVRTPAVGGEPSPAATNLASVRVGLRVSVVQKEHQRTGERTEGVVLRLLTKASHHPRGIKVMLESGVVGRVREIVAQESRG